MNLQILSNSVRRLRNAKRLSQKSLADMSGVSLPAIKNLETGKNEPRMNTVQAIAQALGVQLQELFVPFRELKTVRFRSVKQLKSRENILADVSRWLDDFDYLEEILNAHVPFKLVDVQRERNDIPRIASECRWRLGVKDTEAIRDVCGLLEFAGIKVYQLSIASDGFFGLSIGKNDNGPAVVVNTWERICVERQIFSAAHELGHLILHREAFDVSKIDEDKTEEQEADVFAAHFLMPNEGFQKEWRDAAGLRPVERVFKVKRMFHMSYKAILYRLIELGVADNSVWQKFNAAYQRHFPGRKLGHKEEPYPMAPFDFSEDRFSGLVRKAIESDKISLSRGAEILRISIGEMRDLINQWKDAL